MAMKRSKYTESQVVFALKQAETGTPVAEVCRKMGISEATFYNWKKKYGSLGTTELRRLAPQAPRYTSHDLLTSANTLSDVF